MRKVAAGLGGLLAVLALAAGGGWLWVESASSARLQQTFEVASPDIPVPWPLSEEELVTLAFERSMAAPPDPNAGLDFGADPVKLVDATAEATQRAVARGKHLLEARYGCNSCHGADLGGGVMLDAAPMGTLLGPNLTQGAGSVVKDYTIADWDRIVRHGVKRDGHPAVMPAVDYQRMSDQELSDLVSYLGTLPPVDRTMAPPKFGPVLKVLLALGEMELSAEIIDHAAPRRRLPPAEGPTTEYGGHLIGVCTGCHRANLEGGPIVGGDPAWAPAANLTMHETGLSGWTFADFERAMVEGKGKVGQPFKAPMTEVLHFTSKMKPVELQAMWAYLMAQQPVPEGT
jgi:mono/diheme cytochrome c family protein